MTYLMLFWNFSDRAFQHWGGYAAIPLIQNKIVEISGYLTLREFADLITIAEMTPGPIAINSSTFVGMRVAGIGALLLRQSVCNCSLYYCNNPGTFLL